ncbi:MAG: replicative DNA helicase [Verrucomicrobia bacterium]|nr:replicative DNA helicase [Verrucomicrobiota bacterium]
MIDTVETETGGAPPVDLKKARRQKLPAPSAVKVDRLPPHSIDAERGVLGCVFLSPNDCLGICIEKFKRGSEVFYDLRHQVIYEVLVGMYDHKEAIDLITVPQRLKDKNQLEGVGGLAYLASLADAVPSAANLSYYLDIVREKYVLRKLIQTCTEVVGRVYEQEGEVDTLLDEVERDVLRINEERVESSTHGIKELVHRAISTIEEYHQRQGMLTGIATGFADLDKMTSGLHGGEMIVIAARPSMGKCLSADSEIVLADGRVATIESLCRQREARLFTLRENLKLGMAEPSDFVDDGLKPVFRVTTRLGRAVEATLPHPFLTVGGWKQLAELKPGDHIAVPRMLEVFGTDRRRECELKLLAYLIGDGCLTHTCPSFTNGEAALREDFAAAVADFGGVTVRLSDSNGTRTPYLRVVGDPEFIRTGRREFGGRLGTALASARRSARQVALAVGASPVSLHEWKSGTCVPETLAFERLCREVGVAESDLAPTGLAAISRNSKNPVTLWLEELGLWGKGAGGKFIPDLVFTLPRPQVAVFLNRLFATDGWASVLRTGQAQLGYATISERLARQVQHLLLRFGVVAALKKKAVRYQGERRACWQLDITDRHSIETFLSEIGIFGKERALAKVRRRLTATRVQTNRDLVPAAVWEEIARAKGEESWAALARRAGFKGHTNIHVGKRGLSRQRLAALARALKSERLQQLAESDVYWDEIVSIEPLGRKQVYDLTIPQTHNFIANDICVHNTSLAMNIAEHVAIDQKLPVGVFSLEMTADSLVLRVLCSRARVNLRNIREGFLAERDFPKLTGAAGKLANAPLFIDDSPGLSILQLRARARRLIQQYGIKLFVVDYLQLLHSTSRRAENRQQEIADISNGIKALAKELSVPVIVLSQLNRELEKDKSRKPRLSDLRESGAIEQDADLVGLLYKPTSDDDDDSAVSQETDALPVNLLIAKQRNGPTGDVNLTFLKAYTRFESAAKVGPDDVPVDT